MKAPQAIPPLQLRQEFERIYGGPLRIFRAPGRVNLIGEHTDYNDGLAMPAAIGFYTYAAVGPRSDRTICVRSINFDETKEFDLHAIGEGATGHWSDYVRGVAAVLVARGHRLSGANLVILGDVPLGAGLSSSAAIEVATAFALLANSGLIVDRLDIARACQQAEHLYAGMQCGIMDQFISCFGQSGHALMLDCRDLTFEALKIADTVRIMICNTLVKHELASGEYNLRRADCEAAVLYLKEDHEEITSLRDVTLDVLESGGHNMPDVAYRRARHVVRENMRVQAAAEALSSGDLQAFGVLMGESHRSLRDDYEVSCKELDLMVELAERCRGVYGARMTGGGFGGCTVNLVSANGVDRFKEAIEQGYKKATGVRPEIYVCKPADGASEISEGAQT